MSIGEMNMDFLGWIAAGFVVILLIIWIGQKIKDMMPKETEFKHSHGAPPISKDVPMQAQEEEEETNDEEVYYKDYVCENCDEEYQLEIPKGTTLKEFLRTEKCDACGCKLGE